MTNFHKPKTIAEIGCCHLGDFERAKELIRLAKICGADYVKLQKRNPDESTPEHMKFEPHPNKMFAYGETYLEHRQNLELNIEQHTELMAYCSEIGIGYSSSVWDLTSAIEIASLNPDFIKVPSACNRHTEMLEYLVHGYGGDIHISTGMTTHDEMIDLYEWAIRSKAKDRIVIYHCTSKYPCDFSDLHLLEITNLQRTFGNAGIRIGFSNHGKGIAADIAGYMLGASWIERHFIDDRLIRHTDAAASLEPQGMSRLVRDLNAVFVSLKYRPNKMDEEELSQRHKLKVLPE